LLASNRALLTRTHSSGPALPRIGLSCVTSSGQLHEKSPPLTKQALSICFKDFCAPPQDTFPSSTGRQASAPTAIARLWQGRIYSHVLPRSKCNNSHRPSQSSFGSAPDIPWQPAQPTEYWRKRERSPQQRSQTGENFSLWSAPFFLSEIFLVPITIAHLTYPTLAVALRYLISMQYSGQEARPACNMVSY
jgi:hypothetical protein